MGTRLGRAHPDPENAARFIDSPILGEAAGQTGFAHGLAGHRRLRTVLTPYFSHSRMAALEPRVAEIVDEAVTALASGGPSADLLAVCANPAVDGGPVRADRHSRRRTRRAGAAARCREHARR
ncbi:hypothetical protein [Amycolatopsis jejuensis]|uniref:hypothetical protein n=1 Tax=Amycolatopsis jejuensis TaxID=330084 RepID=UPI0012DFF475|nr:hypothetical protein [Amycolatopsis jejuensis]